MDINNKVIYTLLILLSITSSCFSYNSTLSDAVKNIFLSKTYNLTDSEKILKMARESFSALKNLEKEKDPSVKLNFSLNYANFLVKLLQNLKTQNFHILDLFSKENEFLKGSKSTEEIVNVNVSAVKTTIENLQFAAEQHLIAYYNSSDECYDVFQVLSLNKTSFDTFLKENFRTDYTDVGYFFLEVFATLIGLSWGIISTVLYNLSNTNE